MNLSNYTTKVNLCWRHCLHFSSLAYDLTPRSRGRIYAKCKSWKIWLSWGICAIFSSIQAILKEILAIKNCKISVAKKLLSHSYILCKVFGSEFLRNHSVYWAKIFRNNWNCYALLIFRVFILLASSDSDKHMLMRKKVSTNIPLYYCIKPT